MNPQDSQACHYLGLIAYHCGKLEEGTRLIRHAISLTPTVAEFHANLGFLLHHLGAYEDARVALLRAIELRADYPEALNNLGNVFKALQDYPSAISAYQRAIQLQPESTDPYNNLGVVLQKLERWEDSLSMFEQAIRRRPEFSIAYNNLGVSYRRLDRLSDAKAAFQQAVRCDPQYSEAWRNLGALLISEGEPSLALEFLEKSLSLKPDFADAWIDYGFALSEIGACDRAQTAYEQARRFNPDSVEANFNWGASKLKSKEFAEARQAFERVNQKEPGAAALELIQIDQAECRWDAIPVRIEQLRLLTRVGSIHSVPLISPFGFMTLPAETLPAEQLVIAQRWAEKFKKKAKPFFNSSNAQRNPRLRIGYLSADYYDHATSWLIAEMLEKHDRNAFEIFGYSIGPNDGNALRQRIEKSVDHFRDFERQSFRESATAIAADSIDILVDLKGYTQNARPSILAHRPAPIQVNYLGYPGTMGADFIDYIFADEYIIPADQQHHYSEKVFYLPGCYQANDSTLIKNLAAVNRAASGLPDDAIVCCSFNNPYKLAPEILRIWMRLLQKHSKAILWLIEVDPNLAQHIFSLAAQHGVALERIVFAPKLPHEQHLARMKCADLCLDSYPVNAHTTASDALRMGIPLLTLSGKSFISRVAGSLLNHLHMNELIANSFEEYEAKGDELIGSREILGKIKERLAMELLHTDLFDGAAFARKIEQAFRDIWQSYLREAK